ncbi:hypothetical protein HOLleu_05719 [Holothuria leucospilota]|uniref:Uncharacterized protein n=1 Tax=Holothuria leucospilota TaxID=206669 RepID=A0A9Q1HJ74_HOLLE|nr:hypothetical protein HOLleu_05719 [Holothuria leucospilota]
MSFVQDHIFLGQMPKWIIVGCVRNTAFNCSYLENPFNFKQFGANPSAVNMDGEQITYKPLKPTFTADGGAIYIRAHHTLFSGTDETNQDGGNAISRKNYPGKLHTVCSSSDSRFIFWGHFKLVKQGNLRMEMQFEQPLPTPVNVVVYAEMDNIIEIDRARNGVFPSDGLHHFNPTFPCSINVNTEQGHLPGSHWVAIFISQHRIRKYFDSHGLPPSVITDIGVFLNRVCIGQRYNKITLQGLFSTVCLQYAVYFLLHKSRGWGLRELTSWFTHDPEVNDHLVHGFIEKHFPIYDHFFKAQVTKARRQRSGR